VPKISSIPLNRSRIAQEDQILLNIASVATAIEALETILIERGVIQDGELMKKIDSIVKMKAWKHDHMPGDDD